MKSKTKKLKYIESLLPDYISVMNPYTTYATLLGINISPIIEEDVEFEKPIIKKVVEVLLKVKEDEVKILKELDEKAQQQRRETIAQYDTIKISILRGDI